ncbi:MAG: glycosyltransferase [Pseudomonadales bacterium]
MKDILEWVKELDINAKPWLILGKGPSLRKLDTIDASKYFVCTLNHVIREVPAKLAHVIDIDVVIECADEIDSNAEFLVLPYRPHEDNKVSGKSIDDYITEIAVLKKLQEEGRLVCYNLSTTEPVASSPVIRAKFFSAEAALDLLATLGARTARSLGVDGGSSYSNKFEDMNETTRLNNGHDTFDKQFRGIARTIREKNILYGPLHKQVPVRVFVGSDDAQLAGVKVLEYSIKKHASLSVEVVAIDDKPIPEPINPEHRSRSGFSFSRFHIPELCEYKGRAIYVDADMLVFTDIADLWNTPFEGAHVLYSELQNDDGQRIPQTSVMLLDCGKLDWQVNNIIKGFDEEQWDYHDIMYHMCMVPPSKKRAGLPFEWNSLEHYEEGKTRLIHYTDMPTQPWVSNKNKHGNLWYATAREAINEGFMSVDWICEEIEKGHVSPELLSWLGFKSKPAHQKKSENWVAPFRRFAKMKNSATATN